MKKTTTPYCEDPDNLEFVELVEQQGGFGQVQAEVAKVLGISPGQLSRIKKGERHASRKHIRVLREHVHELAKQRQIESRQPAMSIFAISHAVLDLSLIHI